MNRDEPANLASSQPPLDIDPQGWNRIVLETSEDGITWHRHFIARGDDAVEALAALPAPVADDRFTPCGICQAAPDGSGAQFDQASVTWDGVTIRVCSNCVHASPVSIVDLHKAVMRVSPKVTSDPF